MHHEVIHLPKFLVELVHEPKLKQFMFIETTASCWQIIFGWLRFQPVQACLMYIINPTGYGNKMVCNKIMIVCFENYRLRKQVANLKNADPAMDGT